MTPSLRAFLTSGSSGGLAYFRGKMVAISAKVLVPATTTCEDVHVTGGVVQMHRDQRALGIYCLRQHKNSLFSGMHSFVHRAMTGHKLLTGSTVCI